MRLHKKDIRKNWLEDTFSPIAEKSTAQKSVILHRFSFYPATAGFFIALSRKKCAEKANKIKDLRRGALRASGTKQLILNTFSGRL